MRATNSSAPNPRTSSSSRSAATATVRSPRSLASSTAYPPSAPAAPVTSSHWPGRSASRSSACAAVSAFSGSVAASAARQPARGRRDRFAVQHDLIGLCADRRGQQVTQSDHRLAGPQPVYARAYRVDDAGQIPPDADRACRGHQAVPGEHAGPRREVHRVHRGRLHRDPHLARPGMRHRDIGHLQRLGASEAADDHCLHGYLLGRGTPDACHSYAR